MALVIHIHDGKFQGAYHDDNLPQGDASDVYLVTTAPNYYEEPATAICQARDFDPFPTIDDAARTAYFAKLESDRRES